MSLAAACSLTACSAGASDTAEGTSAGAEETVLSIENDNSVETEPVIGMNLDGALLPVLEGVTTAEDNSALAPAYLKIGEKHQTVLQLQNRLMSLGYMAPEAN